MPDLSRLTNAVQHNCDVSDSRHAGDYGLCTFLLKMREYFRWEKDLPFAHDLPRGELGEWMKSRDQLWSRIEADEFLALPLANGDGNPFDADAANRELLPGGVVYSAGYGRFHKPVFFLGRLLRIEERAGFTILVSSCEYARELAAPPAMLQGRTIFLRQESAQRFLWEKFEEWQWRKQENAMSRALSSYDFTSDAPGALGRMADEAMETMILHEIGEAKAGELLGDAWDELSLAAARTRQEPIARAVRDLLADCLSTLPGLLERTNPSSLHFYFATFDEPRRQIFPQALQAYEHFVRHGVRDRLWGVVNAGRAHWLAEAQRLLALDPAGRNAALDSLLGDASVNRLRALPSV